MPASICQLGGLDAPCEFLLHQRARARLTPGMPSARSIDRIMLEKFCKFAGANLRVEPGPKPTQKGRYREITYCNSSSLVMIHSWTNGEPHEPSLRCVQCS